MKWISVRDGLPKTKGRYKVKTFYEEVKDAYYHRYFGWSTDDDVTYWKPIPKHPKF